MSENLYARSISPPIHTKHMVNVKGESTVVEFSENDIMKMTMANIRRKFTMSRAFPVASLYVIDEKRCSLFSPTQRETSSSVYYDITDYLISARTIWSRENPLQYCILSLDDSSGALIGDGAYFGQQPDAEEDPYASTFSDPLNLEVGGIIRPGIAIELRLGYDNCASGLEIVFIGQISSVDGSDVLTVECQGWGSELTSGCLLGKDKDSSDSEGSVWAGGATTENLLDFVIFGEGNSHYFITNKAEDDLAGQLQHFGKYWAKTRSGLDSFTGLGGPASEPLLALKLNDRTKENMTIPEMSVDWNVYTKIWPVIKNDWFCWNPNVTKFNPWGYSLWEFMKQLELRHPGFITLALPYASGLGTEATLFFGPPNATYVWRGKDVSELITLRTYVEEEGIKNPMSVWGGPIGSMIAVAISYTPSSAKRKQVAISQTPRANIRPFRQYHYLTSEHDIILNDIRLMGQSETYNAVNVRYKEGEVSKNENQGIPSDIEADIQTVKVDDSILDADIRPMVVDEPNSYSQYGAANLGISHLLRHSRDYYNGSLVVVGNPHIKPYDVCIIFDTYQNVLGAIEVGEVEHSISAEDGFVTRIKPDMCVAAEEMQNHAMTTAIMNMLFNISLVGEVVSKSSSGMNIGLAQDVVNITKSPLFPSFTTAALAPIPLAVSATALVTIAGKISSWYIGKSLDFRSPIIFHPLTKNGIPYITGLRGYDREHGGFFLIMGDKWARQDRFMAGNLPGSNQE